MTHDASQTLLEVLLAALNLAIQQLAEDHTLERIYRKYGVWDDRQQTLKGGQQPIALSGGY